MLIVTVTNSTTKKRSVSVCFFNLWFFISTFLSIQFEVLRLEKRLDDELYYLRDCPLEYSTFPVDMESEFLPEGEPVPINETVVPIGPKPWHKSWDRYEDRLYGYTIPPMDHYEQRLHDKYKGQVMRSRYDDGIIHDH